MVLSWVVDTAAGTLCHGCATSLSGTHVYNEEDDLSHSSGRGENEQPASCPWGGGGRVERVVEIV